MPDISLPVTIGNLPEGFCPQTEQQRANAIAAALQVLFPFNFSLLNTGSTAPTADNRIYPWDRSNMDGTPDKIYHFVNGFWIAPNPVPANSPIRLFYLASVGSIDTYDGGETGTVTTTTGPMWEVDTDMSGRTALGVDDDHPFNTIGGAAEITLTDAQLPAHSHDIEVGASLDDNQLRPLIATAKADSGTGTRSTELFGDGDPIDILPPYKAGFWVRRTNRGFYRL